MKRIVLVLTFVALLMSGAVSWAQTDQTGVISGRITDASGAPVADAVVTGALADGSYPKVAVTGSDGAFRLSFLTPGRYTLSIEAEGYTTRAVESIAVSATKVSRITVQIQKTMQVQEEVTVTAKEPEIDTISTNRAINFSTQEVELLPLGRRATAVVDFVPGARENQVWGGVSSQSNAYKFDGVGVNQPGFGGDFLLPNPDWISEVQVVGLGAGAEYGNFQGALVNIVTKSGSNTLRWNVRANYESSSLDSSNLVPGEAGDELDRRWELNADIAGPIIKDKLYYFLSLQEARLDTRVVDLNAYERDGGISYLPAQEERTEKKAFGKLTWQATAKDSFNFVFGYDGVDTENRGLDSFTEPAATTKQESPSIFYNASWQRVFNASNTLEVKFNGFTGDDDRLPYNGQRPAVQILGGDRNLYRNAIYTRKRSPESQALSVKWDSYQNTGSVAHHLKIGGEYEVGKWREQRSRNGRLTWRPEEGDGPFVPGDPATWGFISSDWGGDIDLDTETVNAALFVQDDMTLTPRLSLNTGLRYGKWTGEITPGFGSGSKIKAIDANGWDPRVGLVYDFTGNADLVGTLHWGRFHQSMFALLFDRTRGGNVFRDFEYWDWDADFLPDVNRRYTTAEREELFVLFDIDPLGQEVGPVRDYKQPYLDQWVLGVEKAFGPNLKVGVNYIRRENKNIVALVDRNLKRNYTAYRNVEVIDRDTGGPVPGPDGRPLVLSQLYVSNDDIIFEYEDGGFVAPGFTPEQIELLPAYRQDLVLTNPGGAERTLDQVQLTADYRARHWRINASLVWSDLKGNFDSVSGYSDSAGGEGAGGFVRPNEQVNWNGRLPNNSLWTLKVNSSADLPWGFRGGAYLRWERGEYFTPTFTIDRRNYDYFLPGGEQITRALLFGVNGQRIYTETQGSRRYENLTVLDLHLDRPIQFDKLQWVIALDVFNLLNADTLTLQKTSLNDQFVGEPTTSYGAARARQAGRGVRLSTSFHF